LELESRLHYGTKIKIVLPVRGKEDALDV